MRHSAHIRLIVSNAWLRVNGKMAMSGGQLAKCEYRLPTAGYRLPATGCRLLHRFEDEEKLLAGDYVSKVLFIEGKVTICKAHKEAVEGRERRHSHAGS